MQKDFSYGVVPVYQTETGYEFLLIQHVAGHWSFPKGHPETDETPLQAAQREFEEETGILSYQLEPEISFTEQYYPEKDGQVLDKTVTYYLAWVSDKKVTPQEAEVQAYAWLEYGQALERITFGGAKKILKQVKAKLQAMAQA